MLEIAARMYIARLNVGKITETLETGVLSSILHSPAVIYRA
jgi:hypothetical protein